MEAPKPVGIWIRVSTEDQAQGESPEHHERRARLYAESKGWQVREVYHLEAVSGKSVMEHGETKRMLHDIETGHITALIFSKLARLARNTRELLDFAELFQKCRADLVSLQESIDTSTPAGRLFYTMIAAMAQWEREEIAERVAASVPIRAKLGKPTGGQAPYGYQWEDSQLIPNPNEAPVRKLMYELFLEHRRKKTVARLLNQAGYRTRKGALWADTTIDRLLQDPTAKGIRRANYTKSLGEGKNWVLKPKEEWVLVPVEPIVSEDLWDQCNLILEDQLKKHQRPARKPVHLFTGIAYCACSNHKMYVPSNSPKYTCYKCRNKIGTEDLEELFQHQLKNFFLSSTEVSSYLSKADQVVSEKEELLQALTEEAKRLQQEMDKVYRLYLDDQITSEGFGSRYKPMEERHQQIEEQIPELQAELDFLKIQYLSSDRIIAEARDLYSRWPQLNQEEKRKIIENVAEQIIIGKDEVTINLCYLPSSAELATEKQHNLTVALPFCHLILKAARPRSPAYPTELKTLGDHLRKKRLDLGLLQREVAQRLGVDPMSINYWETNRYQPSLRMIPKIVEFLGYLPYDTSTMTLGERIVTMRRGLGLSREELADRLGVDETTLRDWEHEKRRPMRINMTKLESLFDSFPSTPIC